MATKRVSVSGLPHITSNELKKDQTSSVKTSFLVSTRYYDGGLNTSCQLEYRQLYNAISSQILDALSIVPKGSSTQPIYINASKQFAASTANVGGQGTQTNGVNYMKPIYLKAGSLTAPNIDLGSNSPNAVRPLYMTGGSLMPITANSGAYNRPVYVENGHIKPVTANVGGHGTWTDGRNYIKPIFMSDGYLTHSDKSIGANNNDDIKPVYITGGSIFPASCNSGAYNRPVYVDHGSIKPITATIGGPNQVMYLQNGVLMPGNSVVTYPDTSVNGPGINYQHVASVIFDSNGDKNASYTGGWTGTPEGEESGDELRVLNTSNNPYGSNPIPFLIPESGWYTFTVEAGSKPCAVLLYNGGWQHQTIIAGVDTWEYNILFYNHTAKNMFTYTSFFSAGTIVGVTSSVTSSNSARDDASVYVMKSKRRFDLVPAQFRNGCYKRDYYRNILKCSWADREACATNGWYMEAWTSKRKQEINRYYYPVAKKLKFTKFGLGSEVWGAGDSVRLYVIRENSQMVTSE